jgi:hypothetical protein
MRCVARNKVRKGWNIPLPQFFVHPSYIVIALQCGGYTTSKTEPSPLEIRENVS